MTVKGNLADRRRNSRGWPHLGYGSLRRPRTERVVAVLAAVLATTLLIVGCQGSSREDTNTDRAGHTSPVTVQRIPGIGEVLADRRGFTLYYVATDRGARVTCTGECSFTWPALMYSGPLPERSSLPGPLGKTPNPDGGTQLTYFGWPLYRYSSDGVPGEANGHGLGGLSGAWFAMPPTGP